MQHPAFYFTNLDKIADELEAEGRDEEAAVCRELSAAWRQVGHDAASVHVRTWTAIAEETYPTFIGKTVTGQRMLDVMRYNDVT